MKRFISLLLTLLLFAAPALAAQPESGEKQLELLDEIAAYIEKYALYPPGILSLDGVTAQDLEDDPELLISIVNAWLREDQYGTMMTREEYDISFDTGPAAYGIGIRADISMPLGVYVGGFLSGGGAERSGMEVGAQIVSVAGIDVKDEPFHEIRHHFLGDWWTSVEIGYINPGSTEVFTEQIQRGSLRTANVYGSMIDGTDIGYISISRFGSIVDFIDFDRYYHETLPELGAKSVIIDLRNNPGGQVDTLFNMLNVMLADEGVLLLEYVSSEGRMPVYSTGWDLEELTEIGYSFWQPEKTVILVNKRSASASEVFAGSLQIYDIAAIVGETTHGKAHSQVHITLSSGNVLILSGSRIDLYEIGTYQDIGIKPDHTVTLEVITGADLAEYALDTSRALFRQSVLTERVTALQERLALLGYYRCEPSGVFDDYTLWALNRFQVANDLPQGRFANAATLRLLDELALKREFYIDTQLEFAVGLLGS
jgi:carboxyl-terminal processing protease